jgi:hypothetical protein
MRALSGLSLMRLSITGLGATCLAACTFKDVGYVEINTVPLATATTLYLNSVKLDPLKNGTAVLRHNVGTAKLVTEGNNGRLVMLCEITVRKNRITTVTISVLDRPPRCQCRNSITTADGSDGRPSSVG